MVFDPSSWNLAYRGPINDRVDFERQKESADETYLVDALESVLSGQAVSESTRMTKGCLINRETASVDTSTISYAEHVAPILVKNCAGCHVEGGIGPWAMTGHNMVKGFAPMIKEVVMTRRMPPWHADPHIGHWKDSRGLTSDEKQTIVRWIDAGAPRGTGDDPLTAIEPLGDDWEFGEPDLVLELEPFTVPATGVVEYQYRTVPNTSGQDAWVRAIDIKPGSRAVVHHVLIGASRIRPGASNRARGLGTGLGGYVPGSRPRELPEGTGMYIDKDTEFVLQLHYTPIGKEVVDRTKVGIYFYDEPPSNFLRDGVALNFVIAIPPEQKAHEEKAYIDFDKEAVLYSLLPHSHYRGRSSSFVLVHPDGTKETLLSVPDYDFNWQTRYYFDEPLRIAAGSRLIHSTVYDNSKQNPGNPDPNKTIRFGLQSWDEMLYGAFSYSWIDETTAEPIHDHRRMQASQMFGYLDVDMDGKLDQKELSRPGYERFRRLVAFADVDGDSAVDLDEYLNAGRRLRNAESQSPPEESGE